MPKIDDFSVGMSLTSFKLALSAGECVLANLYEQTGVNPNAAWTLNPRYHTTFRTKIDYEAYPENQEEVDAIVVRLHLGEVIYGP